MTCSAYCPISAATHIHSQFWTEPDDWQHYSCTVAVQATGAAFAATFAWHQVCSVCSRSWEAQCLIRTVHSVRCQLSEPASLSCTSNDTDYTAAVVIKKPTFNFRAKLSDRCPAGLREVRQSCHDFHGQWRDVHCHFPERPQIVTNWPSAPQRT